MSLLRKSQQRDPNYTNRYEPYRFIRNPFPRNPGVVLNSEDVRENGEIFIPDIREDEINKFTNLLIPSPDRESTKNITFLMDYATSKGRGIGKTAFLNYQNKLINKDLGSTLSNGSEVLFAVHVIPIPNENYRRFWNVSKLIIESLIDQDIISMALCRIRAFYGGIDENVLNNIEDNLLETIGNDNWLKEQYNALVPSQQVDISYINQNVKTKLREIGLDTLICDRFARYGYNASDIRRWYYDGLKDSHWRKSGNQFLFSDLTKLFKLADFTKGIILFDELEKITVFQNIDERRGFCEALRAYFIDGNNENTRFSFFEIILTIHPYLQALLNPHWSSSGLDRFAALSGELTEDYTVLFHPLKDKDLSGQLAIGYMNRSRLNPDDNDSVFPFTNEALIFAWEKTSGIPGIYLNYLYKAIEKGLQEKWDSITIDKIETIFLSSRSIYDDSNYDEGDYKLSDTQTKLK